MKIAELVWDWGGREYGSVTKEMSLPQMLVLICDCVLNIVVIVFMADEVHFARDVPHDGNVLGDGHAIDIDNRYCAGGILP